MFGCADDSLLKKERERNAYRPRSLYYEGLPSPRRQPRLVNRKAGVTGSHKFQSVFISPRPTAAIPISHRKGSKVLQSRSTGAGRYVGTNHSLIVKGKRISCPPQ